MPKYVNIKSYSIKIRKTNCFFSDVPAGLEQHKERINELYKKQREDLI